MILNENVKNSDHQLYFEIFLRKMADDEKKIEIDGPVEIIIGSKEEEKKASSMPTKCKDGEKIYFSDIRSEEIKG